MSVNQEIGTNAIEQDRYHEDKSFQVVILALMAIALTVVIVGLSIMLRDTAAPPPVYFSASADGALVPEKPLVEPSIETNELLNWITEAMMESNTLNFVDYQKVIDAANVYYTKEGYESYKNALEEAQIIDTVVQKKYVLRAIATDAPQLLLEKPFAGRYMWKIKIPMQFKYQNVTTDISELVEITLIVMRVPTALAPNGVLILKFDLEKKGPGYYGATGAISIKRPPEVVTKYCEVGRVTC